MQAVKFLPHIALVIVVIFYIPTLNHHLSVYDDNANFILLSKSLLTEGQYRVPNCPDPPPHIKFPFVLPVLLMPIIAIFGVNILAMKMLITVMAVGVVWLTYRLFLPIVGPWRALLLMLLTGFSPHIGAYTHKVMSEIPFMLFLISGLIYLHRYHQEDEWRTKSGLIASLLITLAYFTRSVGLFVAVGAISYLLIEGFLKSRLKLHLKKAIAIGLVFAISCIAWEVRNWDVTQGNQPEYVNQFMLKDPYTPENGSIRAADLVSRVHENHRYYVKRLGMAVFNHRYVRKIWERFLSDLVFYVTLVGLINCLIRRRTAIEYVTLAYLLIIYAWPWRWMRFIVPILPFAYYYFITGVELILAQIARLPEEWGLGFGVRDSGEERGSGFGVRDSGRGRRGRTGKPFPSSLRTPNPESRIPNPVLLSFAHLLIYPLICFPLFILACYPLATHIWVKYKFSTWKWMLTASIVFLIPVVLNLWRRVDWVKCAGTVLSVVLVGTTLVGHIRLDIIKERDERYYYAINRAWGEYVAMAAWIKANTPGESVVLSLSPSLMYTWSGRYAYEYPYTTDGDKILQVVEEKSIDYVVVDTFGWTDTTKRYIKPVIRANPERFEVVKRFPQSTVYRVVK